MPTPFQKRVYAALEQVPRGQVTTYKQLAECLGCCSCRAVGQALKHNPYAPKVPCHRVIASDLTPGGFMGRCRGTALRRKLDLLAKEGVRFHAGKLAEPSRIFSFPDRRTYSDFPASPRLRRAS
ncbi:MAG: MGMT family protein [Verrucomicrobia bacterium]|nr:MGMT family protein [Verrucomicrobiota bacterium]MBU1735081.1 MGMT family protein [Verrucomicrobiota bacterium]MBU1857934.1 MGMT family protein [Verrucomicrobiota bacterium]